MGGVNITDRDISDQEAKDNVYLFPSMLDQYQIQLTKMLEQEQYEEAKQLLRFLVTCQGDERQYAEEWKRLLEWLEQSFPTDGSQTFVEGSDAKHEEYILRKAALNEMNRGNTEDAIKKIMAALHEIPAIDQQLLLLERAMFIESDLIDQRLVDWIEQNEHLHPIVQFKALQTLNQRGVKGTIQLNRLGELVTLEINDTPLELNEFPNSVNAILHKAITALELIDVTMPHLAEELWAECLQCLYGTRSYQWMLEEDESIEDCFAAALHHTIQLIVYGQVIDDEIRESYGITEEYRFRYEQAIRVIREIAFILQDGI